MKNIIFAFLILFSTSCISNPKETEVYKNSVANPISHSIWNDLLSKYVSKEGNVNYEGFKKDPNFQKYISLLSSIHPNRTWSENEQKAYWLNVYNAFTVKLITDNYPVKSIKDIGGVNGPWKVNFIVIAGVKYDLDAIEHKILRIQFDDPRIHVGVNCASFSCPPLPAKAFTGENVDAELDKLMKSFLSDTKRNKISTNKLELSEIFNWFRTDFTKNESLIDFLNRYSKVQISQNAKINFMPYNWNLNK